MGECDLSDKLSAVLETTRGERAIHAFLKMHPEIVGCTFGGFGPVVYCFPEFQFGSEFRADFLVWAGGSDLDQIVVVELKSPKAKLYLRDGTQSRELRVAVRQMHDIRHWISEHKNYFMKSLDRLRKVERKGLIFSDEHNRGRTPWSVDAIRLSFCVVMGRRARLTDDEQHRRSLEALHGELTVATYDRLVEVCKVHPWLARRRG